MSDLKTIMPRYDSYKDSGVEWIGEIPGHWKLFSFRYQIAVLTDYTANGSFANLAQNVTYLDTPSYSRLIRLTDLRSNLMNDGVYVDKEAHNYLKKSGLTGGELLIANVGAYAGLACIMPKVGIPATLGPNMFLIKLKKRSIFTNYIHYLINSKLYWRYIQIVAQSSAQPKLNKDDIRKLPVVFPFLKEQTTIANFLDCKTAKIDQAVAIKEKQIQLLKERKQILIQDAVTKGLDPDVPMKDSGVEWIGEIPKHWNIKRLRLIGNTQNGISAGAEFFGSGYPFVSYSDVYNNRELPNLVKGLAKSSIQDRIQYSVKKGDVLFTRTSETVEEIGFTSVCMNTIKDSTFAGFLIRFRPKQGVLNPGFSKYYLSSNIHRSYFVREMNLVTRASLSQELLKNLPVVLPPYKEQLAVYNFIQTQSAKIDKAITIQEKMIEKLKEYKATLINSAVTGKIKVPGAGEDKAVA